MEYSKDKYIMGRVVSIVKLALMDAKSACDLLTDAKCKDVIRAEAGAVAIAAQGLSHMLAAEALYLMVAYEPSATDEFMEILAKYETFVDEITSNFSTHHSHQWSLIQRDELFRIAEGTVFDSKV